MFHFVVIFVSLMHHNRDGRALIRSNALNDHVRLGKGEVLLNFIHVILELLRV